MRKRRRILSGREDQDPVSSVANPFDVAMVFVVALMMAPAVKYDMTEIFSQEDYTIVKNPGKDNMEIITKEGETITKYKPSQNQEAEGRKGRRVGAAYELDNDKIVYIPE